MIKNAEKNAPSSLITFVVLFLAGLLVLAIRNPDPFINQVVYTEDGQWIGLALTKGWLYTLFNAKEGYFVWGNLGLLWAAVNSSDIFCGNSLVCLPQSIAVFSLAFFSGVATLAFFAMRPVASPVTRLLMFCLLLMLPMGDSSNEILGRVSNIGYLCVLVAVLLMFQRDGAKSLPRYIIDSALLVFAGTNPVVVPLLALYLAWRLYCSPEKKTELLQNKFLAIGLLTIGALLIVRFSSVHHSSITGVLQPQNLIEVGLARAILYPLLFPYYANLSNLATVTIFGVWVLFVIFAFRQSEKSARVFIAFNLVALITFFIFTVAMRQSLTEQLGGYKVTFPDRYFIGLNAIVLVITVTGLSQFIKHENKTIGRLGIISLSLIYISSVPWIFETKTSRFPILLGSSYAEQICATTKSLPKMGRNDFLGRGGSESTSSIVTLPIYFEGWTMSVPTFLLVDAGAMLNCQAVGNKPLNINDANWSRGIARNWAGFVIKNSSFSQDSLTAGVHIRFANGSIRHIVRQEQNGAYLNIYLDGRLLDGALVGYPNNFEVENE